MSKVLVPLSELPEKYWEEGMLRIGQYVELNEADEDFEGLSYIVAAMTITSYARCEELRAIRANKHRFVYGDTDSMVLLGAEDPAGIRLDDNDYGA